MSGIISESDNFEDAGTLHKRLGVQVLVIVFGKYRGPPLSEARRLAQMDYGADYGTWNQEDDLGQ